MSPAQLPFAPAAGFLQAVAGEPYPTFPSAGSPIKTSAVGDGRAGRSPPKGEPRRCGSRQTSSC